MQRIVKSKITNIKSTHVRNLLRGIVGEKKPSKIKRTLDKIYLSCTENDYKRSIIVIRNSAIFINNPVSREFTKICPVDMGVKVEFTPHEMVTTINNNKERVFLLVSIFKKTT